MVLQETAGALAGRCPALIVLGRCFAELKYLYLLIASMFSAIQSVRTLADQSDCQTSTADACAGLAAGSCAELYQCVATSTLDLTYGIRLVDYADLTALIVLLVLLVGNVVAVLVCVCLEVHEEGWNVSDIALCYEINKQYASSVWLRAMRIATLVLVLATVTFAIIVSAVRGTCLVILSNSLFMLISVIISVANMWTPEASLEGIPFRIFKKRAGAAEFAWADLLLSAPAVLTQKLSVWSKEEELAEMREEMKELKA